MSMVACGKMRYFKNQTQPHTHAVYVDPYDVKLNHELPLFWEAGLPRTCIVHGRGTSVCISISINCVNTVQTKIVLCNKQF